MMAKKKVFDLSEVEKMASNWGWDQIAVSPDQVAHMRSFRKEFELMGHVRLNVCTSGKISTALKHPKDESRGRKRNQLYRQLASLPYLESILKNPRAHTSKGYRTSPKRNQRTEISIDNNSAGIIRDDLNITGKISRKKLGKLHRNIEAIKIGVDLMSSKSGISQEVLREIIADRQRNVAYILQLPAKQIFKPEILEA